MVAKQWKEVKMKANDKSCYNCRKFRFKDEDRTSPLVLEHAYAYCQIYGCLGSPYGFNSNPCCDWKKSRTPRKQKRKMRKDKRKEQDTNLPF